MRREGRFVANVVFSSVEDEAERGWVINNAPNADVDQETGGVAQNTLEELQMCARRQR